MRPKVDSGFVMVRTSGGVYRLLDPIDAALEVARGDADYFPPRTPERLHGTLFDPLEPGPERA